MQTGQTNTHKYIKKNNKKNPEQNIYIRKKMTTACCGHLSFSLYGIITLSFMQLSGFLALCRSVPVQIQTEPCEMGY